MVDVVLPVQEVHLLVEVLRLVEAQIQAADLQEEEVPQGANKRQELVIPQRNN